MHLDEMKCKAVNKTLGDVETKELVDTLANTLLEVELVTLRNTLADVMTKALIDASADTLAELEAD